MGPDTGLCMLSAQTQKSKDLHAQPSVLAILNKQADFRWGDTITSARSWYHSDDVIILQAQEQGKWDEPLKQARAIILERIRMVK